MTIAYTGPVTRLTVPNNHHSNASDTPLLSDAELREIAQAAIVACYDESALLGAVADELADILLDGEWLSNPCGPVAAALGIELNVVRQRVQEVRNIARRVHLEETGLPAPW